MHRLNSNVIIINRNYGSEQYCALLYVAIDVDVIVIVVVVVKIIVVDVAELVLYIMNILAGCHRIRPRPCAGSLRRHVGELFKTQIPRHLPYRQVFTDTNLNCSSSVIPSMIPNIDGLIPIPIYIRRGQPVI